MRKIGIITHYDVHNHGAVLQLNALIQVLRSNKYNVKALRFDKNYDYLGNKSKYDLSLKSIPIYLRYIIKNGIKKTWYNIRKRKLLELFKDSNNLIGRYYYEEKNLDAVIIGSDEVFALHTGPTPVFFGYCCPSKNIFSYAGSFGPTTLEQIQLLHCESLVKGGLSSMKSISVRDENSCDIIKKLTGRDGDLVCDPVLLYGYEDEISKTPVYKGVDYILIYSYDNNMNDMKTVRAIKEFATANKLKVFSVGFYHSWCDKNINVDPIELFHYFKNSTYVITDTFHGSILSILTQKEFAVVLRNNANKLLYLLKEHNLESQVLMNLDIENVFAQNIDYSAVNKYVHKKREVSLNFLLNSLNHEY